MLQTRAEIWGTLKRYLIYTAAGFVVLGGVGAMEAAQPPLVGQASASQPGQGQASAGTSLRSSVSPEALLASIRADAPSWTQRLRFDLGSDSGSTKPVQTAAVRQPVPYYPAPDTAEPKDSAPVEAAASEPTVSAAPASAMAAVEAAPSIAANAAPTPILIASAAEPPAPLPQPSEVAAEHTEPAPPPAPTLAADLQTAKAPTAQPAAPAAPTARDDASDDKPALPSLVATLNWVYGSGDASDPSAKSADASSPAPGDPTTSDTGETDMPAAGTGTDTPVEASGGSAFDSESTPAADPAAVAASNAPATSDILGEQKVIQVRRGDTLFGLLTRAGLSEAEAQAAGHSLADVFSPSDLKVGQEITLSVDTAAGPDASSEKLLGLSLQPSAERDIKLTRSSDGQFVSASIDKPLTERVDRAAGQIDISLFESARDAGVPVGMIGDIIKAFSYDVDFQRDIHDGDSFEVMFEHYDNANGDLAKLGRMLYASLTLGGKPMAIYYFEKDGDGEYYTADGLAVRKSLLKTPIDGAKITSGYGMRVNPILGYSMMHQGVDFGAPVGTPIFAAGNGVVEQIGWVNGYGNYMKLRHNGTYETAYAHISKFAINLKRGTKVKQGQVIAYVGETGRATGPHLHFEVLVNGQHVNPSTVKTVAEDKLIGKDLAAFKTEVASIEGQRRTLAARAEIADQSGSADIDCRGPRGCQN